MEARRSINADKEQHASAPLLCQSGVGTVASCRAIGDARAINFSSGCTEARQYVRQRPRCVRRGSCPEPCCSECPRMLRRQARASSNADAAADGDAPSPSAVGADGAEDLAEGKPLLILQQQHVDAILEKRKTLEIRSLPLSAGRRWMESRRDVPNQGRSALAVRRTLGNPRGVSWEGSVCQVRRQMRCERSTDGAAPWYISGDWRSFTERRSERTWFE